ncbi:peptidase S8 [Kutzneria viridogrisea]|uniref:Subtilase family serine protease n=1 Tax=Kutzneria viridogrisea TaxID=47990 RepID=A0ABR6BED9_9PSEU|nr:subtilase family serine protease [Kutzneria viridogrisea]
MPARYATLTATITVLSLTTGLAPAAAVQQSDCTAAAHGHATCQAVTTPGPTAAPHGLTPADLRAAYQLPEGGAGVTVAVVDAGGNARAESDLATYRRQFGLPACGTADGCLRIVDQRGGTALPAPVPGGWPMEISLDLDAVSAACPRCHLLLVEADTSADTDLYAAEDTALRLGARLISNSWLSDVPDKPAEIDKHFAYSGVLFAFATGDEGYRQPGNYPASSPYTLAVGGTTLRRTPSGWAESAWSGAGSGCATGGPAPAWQTALTSACGGLRTSSDVSAVGDPATGLAVYNTATAHGWQVVGGTSLSTPLVTAMYTLAGGVPPATERPAAYPYRHPGALTDVTSGSNGGCGAPLCQAGPGWDGPTGLGSPLGKGVTAFTP